MILVDAAGDAHNRASGVLVPVGGAQSCKGGNHITAVGVLYLLGHILGIRRGIYNPHLVPQPLDGGAGNEDGTFQSIIYFAVQAPGNGGNQAVLGEYRLLTCVHQHKAAGSVCILCLARIETGLAEKSCLLVACRPSDGDWAAKELRVGFTVYETGWFCFRKHALRNV